MICVTSATCIRLAQARAEMAEAEASLEADHEKVQRLIKANRAFKAAAIAMADELVGMQHHMREGD